MGNIMPKHRAVLAAVAALLVLPAATSAKGTWKRVSLNKQHDLTIEVPAGIGTHYLPDAAGRANDELLDFEVQDKTGWYLFCTMNRTLLDKPATRQSIVDDFKASKGSDVCSPLKGITALKTFGSRTLTIGGYPAANCTMSFHDAKAKPPGMVLSDTAVAGPGALYVMTCDLRDTTQAKAEADWHKGGAAAVTRITQSLRVPKAR